jgi:hypothetical protein
MAALQVQLQAAAPAPPRPHLLMFPVVVAAGQADPREQSGPQEQAGS